MAQTPEEISAEKVAKRLAQKVARKQAQIAVKVAQIASYEAKKLDANSVRAANMVLSGNATDAKVKAKLDKSVVMLEKRIGRLQGSINRLQEKRVLYAQELALLLGPF